MSLRKTCFVVCLMLFGSFLPGRAQATVLTYNGTSGGDWFASGVWLNQSGEVADWQDGAVAVITNLSVTLTSDAVVYGLQVHMSERRYVYGTGQLTIGAGGINMSGSLEFNIQNQGGLHLSDSQSWTASDNGMICIDGHRAFTAEDGVVLTGEGNAVLRMNAGGGMGSNTVIRVTENAAFSLSASGSLGSSEIILDGAGIRLSADSGYNFADSVFGRSLVLRNGASMSCSSATFSLDAITVEAPVISAVSYISGSLLTLNRTQTALDVASGATLQMNLPLAAASGVDALLAKSGTGDLVLNSASTFPGGVAVSSGNLQLLNTAGAGSGPITLGSSATLSVPAEGTLANIISGDGSLVKSGSTTLTLPNTNSYTGSSTLSGGITRVASMSSLGTGSVNLSNDATLIFTSTQSLGASDRSRISGSGNILAAAGTEVEWGTDYDVTGTLVIDAEKGGTLIVGQLTGSAYEKTGAGKIRISGTTGYSGEIVVSGGVLDIGSTANLASGVTVQTTGDGIVQVDSLDGQDFSKITGSQSVALADGASVDINTDSLSVTLTTVQGETWTASPLSGSSDLYKYGEGTLIVSNAASFSANVYVLEGTLQSESAIGSGMVTVSNGVFSAYGAGTVLLNNYIVAGGTLAADNGGSLGAGSISLLSGATLCATNSGSLGSGSFTLGAGILRMDKDGTAGTRALTMNSSGQIQVYDGAGFDDTTLTIGGGTLDFRATTTMNIGVTLTANTVFSANTPSGAVSPTIGTLAGAITTTARSKLMVRGNARLRLAGGGSFISGGEIFIQSGGDLSIVSNEVSVTGYAGLESGGKRLAVSDGGTFSMIGSGKLHAGYGSGNAVIEVLTNGTFFVKSGVDVRMAVSSADCTFRIDGGVANIENGGVFIMGDGSTSSDGCIELLSGTLQTSRQIVKGTGTAEIFFNGGTLQSDGSNSYNPWVAEGIPVSVDSEGGSIDTLGLDMILGSAGIEGVGSLVQCGGGSVTYARSSTEWSGGLTLIDSTAIASGDNSLGTGTVTLNTNLLQIVSSIFLPNTLLAPVDGGSVMVENNVTGSVALVSGGLLVKQGEGALLVDEISDGSDVSIQSGLFAITPLEDVIHLPAGNPAIWMDATVAESFGFATSNEVTRWYDRRTPGDTSGFYASKNYNSPLVVSNVLNGLPVLDFGTLGQSGLDNENRMLVFKEYQTEIRTVFWVIGSRNGGGFLLGDNLADGSKRHFHRGNYSGTYGGVPSDPLWHSSSDKGIVRNGETWTNGIPVNGTTTGLSGDYDLVTWRLSETDDAINNTPGAIWFASCYASGEGRLNGGQELAEVLIYTNRLTDAEMAATEHYLNRKWFPSRIGAALKMDKLSLDGAGAGFINAYTGSVQMAELTVNATNVYVCGEEGRTSVSQVLVTASGVIGPSVSQALSAEDLVLDEGATLEAAVDEGGTIPVFALSGDLSLPSSACFFVSGGIQPQGKALLISAEGEILTDYGATTWSNIGTESHAAVIYVDLSSDEVWLNPMDGTLILVR